MNPSTSSPSAPDLLPDTLEERIARLEIRLAEATDHSDRLARSLEARQAGSSKNWSTKAVDDAERKVERIGAILETLLKAKYARENIFPGGLTND
jgi:hypothetical protein